MSMKCTDQIDRLRETIKRKHGPGDLVGTEFELSRQWGVARNTVRRGIDALVQEGLVERRPGKGLFVCTPGAATRIVQLVVPNLAWWHITRIVRGVQESARERGVEVLIYDARGDMSLDLHMLRRLPESGAHGAIIASLHHRQFSEVLLELKVAGFPFVLIDQQMRDFEIPTVVGEDYRGAYLAGQKIAEAGHRRSIFVGPIGIQAVAERLNGFRDALLDAGILFNRSMVVNIEGDGVIDWFDRAVDQTGEILLPWLTKADRPTVIFDGSGDLASHIYSAARRASLRIPDDLSVVTFDESPTAVSLEPEVTRLQHFWGTMGKAALDMLARQMDSNRPIGERQTCEHEVLGVAWVPGASLAPPPKALAERSEEKHVSEH
jgi:GntR family transcriptional regulator, arabinose operon transcriptional repressor